MSAKPKKGLTYDSDEGMMGEIRRLTAPPGPRPAKVAQVLVDVPLSQKNWKSVNAQYCIVCKEGGELLCCDTCPASFHLLCHQPPIWRDEIPEGNWMCNRCQHTTVIEPKSALDPNETEEERNRRAALREMVGSESSDDPLSLLARAALVVNAQQFDLPYELARVREPLPFDELRGPKHNAYGHNCSHCHISNDARPQVRCDFCPAIYHLDCLNPPLCSQPKEKWMCPNHVEAVVDRKMLKSISLVERRRLWNKYARQDINEITITRQFMKKANDERKNRTKKPCYPVRVAVKDLYQRRWDEGDDRIQFATEDERKSWLDLIAGMHASAAATRIQYHPEQIKMEEEDNGEDVKMDTSELLTEDVVQSTVKRILEQVAANQAGFKKPAEPVRTKKLKPKPKPVQEIPQAVKPTPGLMGECISRLKTCKDEVERQVLLLALEKLHDDERRTTVRRQPMPVDQSGRLKFNSRMFLPDRPIIAVLKAEGDNAPLAIQRNVTTIGTSETCHVLLNSVKDNICLAVARQHASIVFDKVTRRFELHLFGNERAKVDGVWYGKEYGSDRLRCACAEQDISAVEGVAPPLRHGSHVTFGCTQFVFASFF